MDEKEKDLIERAKSGDIKSFEDLLAKYKDKIYNIAGYVCLGAPSETDDVYQETFLTAFKKIKNFKGNSNLGTWLYRIAANNCWMRFRKRKKENLVSLDEAVGLASHKENIKNELSHDVLKALSELSVDYRLAVTLVDIEGMTLQEASKILKISVGALKSRLLRARRLLKNKFSAQ
ncbi:MAG: RNA polymerase sigma factor [Elusimicrobia bacterium]|nr:RNA polymerase sigma factor [Elusimicrobiota bacterium]